MSRTIKFAKAGGPEVLDYVETEIANPGPGEVRITVKAIGINRAESMWRLDDYIEPVLFPAGLGYEAAGIIDALGEDVTGFAVGDAVNLIPAFSMNDYGTYGEVIIAPAYAVVKQPAALSFTEAASVWMMFVTAYGALIEDAKVGKGARVAFDPVGGATFAKLLSALSLQGIVYLYGALSPEDTILPVLEMLAKMPTIKAHNIWSTSGDETRRKAAVDYMLKGFESGALKPVIDRIFTFDEIADAHRYLEQNGQFGKIVVTV